MVVVVVAVVDVYACNICCSVVFSPVVSVLYLNLIENAFCTNCVYNSENTSWLYDSVRKSVSSMSEIGKKK